MSQAKIEASLEQNNELKALEATLKTLTEQINNN